MVLFTGDYVELQSDRSRFSLEDGVPVIRKTAEEIGGEHEVQGVFFRSVLWSATVYSAVGNFLGAWKRKLFSGSAKSIERICQEMGRSKEHYSCFFADRTSPWNHQTKWGATQWPSLTIFYNYHEKVKPLLGNDFSGMMTRFYIGRLENRQAVTNRMKLVISLIKAEIMARSEARIFSIASGSAEAVIEAIKACPGRDVKVVLLDIDRSALKRAMESAKAAGLESNFSCIRATPRKIEAVCRDFKPNIIEMVGFLDYLNDVQAIDLFGRIRNCLAPGSAFITCNILFNHEKSFLDHVLLWRMVYRDIKGFVRLFRESGWQRTTVYLEPFDIHAIAVCET